MEAQQDRVKKREWTDKVAFLDAQIRQFQVLADGGPVPPRIFISYSKQNGTRYFVHVKKLLTEFGYEVVTGFDDAKEGQGQVLKNVLEQLKRSTVYLGILTKDVKIETPGAPRWSPAVWVMEEKGMALGLEKAFVLLVDEDMDPDSWQKTSPQRIHIFFKDKNFLERLEQVVRAVDERYQEVSYSALTSL